MSFRSSTTGTNRLIPAILRRSSRRSTRSRAIFALSFKLAANNRKILEAAFPPERFTLPGHDPKKEYDAIEAYLKTYSDQTIRNIFWSGNNYVLPKTPAKIGTKITYWYGDEEKKDRRSNIRFIKHYFPQARIHGIPKMAHAELVMIYPEEFCRYFDKFMCR